MSIILTIILVCIIMYLFLLYLDWCNNYNNIQKSNITKSNIPWYDFLVAPSVMCETLSIIKYNSSYFAAKHNTVDIYDKLINFRLL